MLRLLQYSYTMKIWTADRHQQSLCELNARAYSKHLESERSAVVLLHYVQLEQIKVNALCMVNSKTLHHGFLGPELKLNEELTRIRSVS